MAPGMGYTFGIIFLLLSHLLPGARCEEAPADQVSDDECLADGKAGAGCTLSALQRRSSKLSLAESGAAEAEMTEAEAAVEGPAFPGQVANVRFEYFTGNVDCRVPDLSTRRAQRVLQIPNVNIKRTSLNEGAIYGISTGTNWAARFTGLLRITTGGRYNFRVSKYTADSAALTIDGHQLFSSDCGEYSPTGSVNLAADYHRLVLTFADDGWRDELVLSYQGPDTAGVYKVVPTNQFSDAEWTLGGEGQDCDRVCSAVGKQCHQGALGSVRTAADVQRVASLASHSCSSTRGWVYPNNPGICTNSRCCRDGSCIGVCAYGHSVSSCSGAPAGHYSRLCPCRSAF